MTSKLKLGLFLVVSVMITAGSLISACESDKEEAKNNNNSSNSQQEEPTNNNEDTLLSTVCSNYEIITPVTLDESLTLQLNEVFSQNNPLVKDIPNESFLNGVLFVIKDSLSFTEFCNETSIINSIDFDNYMLVWGKITTGSFSDKLIFNHLLLCNDQNTYNYCVTMRYCTEGCFQSIRAFYYWDIYPKINSDIELNMIHTWEE